MSGYKIITVKSRFSTSRLFSQEATFFVAKIFDEKYKKHTTNKIRSSRPEVF